MSTRQRAGEPTQFLANLMRELFQTETSALRHCRREADRLGNSLPAQPMRAISEHAKLALSELPQLATREQLQVSLSGSLTGSVFSELRDKLFDGLMHSERSYRLTLLSTRHGLDLVRLLGYAAEPEREALARFCAGWLSTRSALVHQAEQALFWFAQHPEQASRIARPLIRSLGSRRSQARAN